MFFGVCKDTRTQPAKLKTVALKEHHLNGSRQIIKEKKNVKTDDVEDKTVFVATEVYKRLELNIHCAHSQRSPIVDESHSALRSEDFCLTSFISAASALALLALPKLLRKPQCLASRGNSKDTEDALLNSVTNTGFSKCTPANIIWIVTLEATHKIIVPPSIKKPIARLEPTLLSASSISPRRGSAPWGECEDAGAQRQMAPQMRLSQGDT
jgi:hypothetical protein